MKLGSVVKESKLWKQEAWVCIMLILLSEALQHSVFPEDSVIQCTCPKTYPTECKHITWTLSQAGE